MLSNVEGGLGSERARTYVPSEDRLLTVREVAARMRVSNMTVYRLIQAGDLRAIRVGRSYRLRQGDVNSYLGRGIA